MQKLWLLVAGLFVLHNRSDKGEFEIFDEIEDCLIKEASVDPAKHIPRRFRGCTQLLWFTFEKPDALFSFGR